MIDLCVTCANELICYLDWYVHKGGTCNKYIAKWEVKHNRSAVIKAHPPHSAQKTYITRAKPVNRCPECKSLNTRKYGHFKDRGTYIRRYQCLDCGEKFGESEEWTAGAENEKGTLGSVQMRQKMKDKLAALKREGESFEDVIARLIKEQKTS